MSVERDRKVERAREALSARDEEVRADAEDPQVGSVDRTSDHRDLRPNTGGGDDKQTADKRKP